MTEPRIPTLPEDQWDDDVRQIMGSMPQAANIFLTLANHPKLMKRWMVFANHVLGKNTLPPREREILILRAGWNCQAEYEWGQHARIGRQSGLSDEEVERIADGPDAPGWSEADALLLRAADELHQQAKISDQTWAALAETWDTHQLMDIVFTYGQYTLVSMALNSFGVQRDEGVEGLPVR